MSNLLTKKLSRNEIAAVILACCLIGPVLVLLFAPLPYNDREPAQNSSCLSNLNQIGKAMSSYLGDWEDTFPTNRVITGTKVSKVISDEIPLTPAGKTDAKGQPEVFTSGINWVEALYPYVERVGAPGDNSTRWKCPKVRSLALPPGSPTAQVTYVLNGYLVEMPGGICSMPDKTVMVRESDRLVDAVLRPTFNRDVSRRPTGAFLTKSDSQLHLSDIKDSLHGQGSNILFVDGHVKNLSRTQMPTDDKLVWDPKTKQWWNFGPKDPLRYIAVTP